MFYRFFIHELTFRLRSRVSWITCAMLFTFWFFATLKLGYDPNMWGASGEVYHNAPLVIYILLAVKGFVAFIALPLFMADPLHRDLTTGTGSWLFALPIHEQSYFWGRFFGSFASLGLIIVIASLSLLLAPHAAVEMGMVEAERILNFPLVYLLDGYVKILLPTLFMSAAIVFSLVVLTRKFAAALIATVVLFLGSIIAVQLSRYGYHNEWLQYINPTGFHAVHDSTLFWTVEQRNSAFIPFTGTLLYNRLLWVGVGLAILIFTALRFSFTRYLSEPEFRPKSILDESNSGHKPRLARPSEVDHGNSRWSQAYLLVRQAKLETTTLLREPLFIALFALCAAWVLVNNLSWQYLQSDNQLPITEAAIQSKRALWMLTFIALPFLASTLIYRERVIGLDAIVDCTPAADWILYGSKLLSLIVLTLLFPTLVMLGGITTQLFSTYYKFDLPLYLTDLYLIYFPYLLQISLIVFTVCVFVNDRIKGFAISILFLYFSVFGHESKLFQHEMLLQLYETDYTYSAFSGYGAQSEKLFWYNLYWLSLSGFLAFLALLFWNRGNNSLAERLKLARQRLTPRPALCGLFFIGVFFISTGTIVYNQHELNDYVTKENKAAKQANYETTYRKLASAPRPVIRRARLHIEFYPDKRRADYTASIQIQNVGSPPIEALRLTTRDQVTLKHVEINDEQITAFSVDPIHRYASYRLPEPLLTGQSKWLNLDARLKYSGFSNGKMPQDLVTNGALLIETLLPHFNYDSGRELSIPYKRHNQGLPKRLPAPDQESEDRRLDWEVTLGTVASQTPIAPGYLERRWKYNGRNYARFLSAANDWRRLALLSGTYTTHQQTWRGPQQTAVEISVSHHPQHGVNTERILKTTERALSYLTTVLGPYPYPELRIVETSNAIPDPTTYEQLILIPEKTLWTADYRNDRSPDYADYIITRELAKLWWSRRLAPSKGKGSDVIAEALAEYLAHRMIENVYGTDLLVKKYLPRTVRSYFFFRAAQSENEVPVQFSGNDDVSIYGTKAALALHALAHIIGTQDLNRLLGDFYRYISKKTIHSVANAESLYQYLLAKLSTADNALLIEYFTQIIDYDLHLEYALYTPLPDGQYHVYLKPHRSARAGKLVPGQAISPKPMEIGIYTEIGKNRTLRLVHLESYVWSNENPIVEIVIDQKPVYATIDPFRIYLDSEPNNNRIRVRLEHANRLAAAGQ